MYVKPLIVILVGNVKVNEVLGFVVMLVLGPGLVNVLLPEMEPPPVPVPL